MKRLFLFLKVLLVSFVFSHEVYAQQIFARSILSTGDAFAGGALWTSPGVNVVPLGSGGRAMNVLRPYANISYTITNVTDETKIVVYAAANLGNIAGQIDTNSENYQEMLEAEKDKLLSKVDGIYLGVSPTLLVSKDLTVVDDNKIKVSFDLPLGFKYYVQNIETEANGEVTSENLGLLSFNYGIGAYLKYNKLILYPSWQFSSSAVPKEFEKAFPTGEKTIHGPGFDLLLPLGENFGGLLSFNHIVDSGNSFKLGLIFSK